MSDERALVEDKHDARTASPQCEAAESNRREDERYSWFEGRVDEDFLLALRDLRHEGKAKR